MAVMKTVTIQIGNSDNKLTQQEWSDFVAKVRFDIRASGVRVHFFGGSANYEPWQNVAWVVEGSDESLATLKVWVEERRKVFRQDSAAWTSGQTEFV